MHNKGELQAVAPKNFEEFCRVEKKRACERLLQICVEVVIDACHLFVAGLRMGLPSQKEELFDKIRNMGIFYAT